MQILHTIDNLYIESGGISTCTYDLLSGLNSQGINTDIVSFRKKSGKIVGDEKPWMKFLDSDVRTGFHYSRAMKCFLKEETIYDLYHTNGVWLHCNHITAKIARKKKKPYIISPHGMLYPQALSYSSGKKKIASILMFDKDISLATCIHATCMQEMVYIREAGYKTPVAVIPNPVNIQVDGGFPEKKNHRRIGFLGRLHPRKRIELLLHAFARLAHPTAELIIMGAGEDEYENFLKKEVSRLSIKNVVFTGFVSGEDKYRLLSSLSALFVPSDFENFGMIVPEALMMKVPVMASLGTPWEDLRTYKCGWWVENKVEMITDTMKEALSLSEQELVEMGIRGRHLVLENYTVDTVAIKMGQLYHWILYGGEKPDFVYMN